MVNRILFLKLGTLLALYTLAQSIPYGLKLYPIQKGASILLRKNSEGFAQGNRHTFSFNHQKHSFCDFLITPQAETTSNRFLQSKPGENLLLIPYSLQGDPLANEKKGTDYTDYVDVILDPSSSLNLDIPDSNLLFSSTSKGELYLLSCAIQAPEKKYFFTPLLESYIKDKINKLSFFISCIEEDITDFTPICPDKHKRRRLSNSKVRMATFVPYLKPTLALLNFQKNSLRGYRDALELSKQCLLQRVLYILDERSCLIYGFHRPTQEHKYLLLRLDKGDTFKDLYKFIEQPLHRKNNKPAASTLQRTQYEYHFMNVDCFDQLLQPSENQKKRKFSDLNS